jgi:hypothetical protein
LDRIELHFDGLLPHLIVPIQQQTITPWGQGISSVNACVALRGSRDEKRSGELSALGFRVAMFARQLHANANSFGLCEVYDQQPDGRNDSRSKKS